MTNRQATDPNTGTQSHTRLVHPDTGFASERVADV